MRRCLEASCSRSQSGCDLYGYYGLDAPPQPQCLVDHAVIGIPNVYLRRQFMRGSARLTGVRLIHNRAVVASIPTESKNTMRRTTSFAPRL